MIRMRSMSLLFLALLAGCDGMEKFPVSATTGTVQCDGKPVVRAMVYFEPKRSGEGAMIGQQGYALTDESGKFTVSTYGEKDGAVVGTHMIRVGKSETSSPCPCALNAMTVQKEVEVTAKGPNHFDITLARKSSSNKDEVREAD